MKCKYCKEKTKNGIMDLEYKQLIPCCDKCRDKIKNLNKKEIKFDELEYCECGNQLRTEEESLWQICRECR